MLGFISLWLFNSLSELCSNGGIFHPSERQGLNAGFGQTLGRLPRESFQYRLGFARDVGEKRGQRWAKMGEKGKGGVRSRVRSG